MPSLPPSWKKPTASKDNGTTPLLLLGHHAVSTGGIRVDGGWEDDDSDWMGSVAEDTNDELFACQATGDCES